MTGVFLYIIARSMMKDEEKGSIHGRKIDKTLTDEDRLPDNLYVADGSILPKAMGNPPILTIMALSKKKLQRSLCRMGILEPMSANMPGVLRGRMIIDITGKMC